MKYKITALITLERVIGYSDKKVSEFEWSLCVTPNVSSTLTALYLSNAVGPTLVSVAEELAKIEQEDNDKTVLDKVS